MVYRHVSEDERHLIARCRASGMSQRKTAQLLGRSPSTISREVARNSCTYDGAYRPEKAHSRALGRRWRSRRNSQYSQQEWAEVQARLRQKWSPKQIVGTRTIEGRRTMSYETIYRWLPPSMVIDGVDRFHVEALTEPARTGFLRHQAPRMPTMAPESLAKADDYVQFLMRS